MLEETERTKRMMLGFQRQMQMHIHLILAAIEQKGFSSTAHSRPALQPHAAFFEEI